MYRYLLGDLPEAEQTALEREFFADGEKFERMWEVENELVDAYARGRLAPADRARFERHYLASPLHRRRVAVARNLIAAVGRPAATPEAPAPARPLLFVARRAWPSAGRPLAAAAVLLLTVAVVWLLADRARLRREISRLESESGARESHAQDLTGQLAAQREQSGKLTAELERLRAAPGPSPSAPPARPSILSFALSPVLVRGAGEPQQLTIARGTDLVRLRLRVEPDDARNFTAWQARLRTVDGAPVWDGPSVRLQAGRGGPTVTAGIPAGRLAAGDYILTLSGVGRAGDAEEYNRYFFRVVRK